ncbi:MAG: polysulfide reductase NrfD [Halioglobus sp.]|jgi:Ni/Fe-hydrogenase subunit HybB-like protein
MIRFLFDAVRTVLQGPREYWLWLLFLAAVIAYGVANYVQQLTTGLVVTGMSDQVSWGFYISNFAFLVGIAAAAVLLVIPAYIFNRRDVKEVVLVGEGIAVAAVIMAMLFVVVDLGRPERFWHMIPGPGRFNFPLSLLAWDVVVLSGYLLLNLGIPFYILYSKYRGGEPSLRLYFPFVVLAIFWAISIHTVTAFLFSANPARPYWHTALLGPRFIASAFVSGPGLIILTLQVIRRVTSYRIEQSVIDLLALIMTFALQINLFFVVAELFTDFYNEGSHSVSIRYLFFGIEGFASLRPWIWTALGMNLVAVTILTIHPLRRNLVTLNIACVLACVGIWIEKGMGLVIPGFIPTPLGEVFEYTPTRTELGVSAAIWALGFMIFTLLAKLVIAVEQGKVTHAR